MIRILIAEDEPAIARGLSAMITKEYPDFEVVALARNGKDGLQKVIELEPDLIFSDINMPVMNGLEMIASIKRLGLSPHFVILTGYADFEYARTAMQIGIRDYLLKPISRETLDGIIFSCRQRHLVETRIFQTEYLQRCLEKSPPQPLIRNPLKGFFCYLFFFLKGPVRGNIYNEISGHEDTLQVNSDTLQQLEAEWGGSLIPLRCRHDNEYLCAFIFPMGTTFSLQKAAEAFYSALLPEDGCLNLFISSVCKGGADLHLLLKELFLYALFNTPFGKGMIHYSTSLTDNKIHISRDIKKICSAIPQNSDSKALYDFLHSMLLFWKENQVTQFQLTTDLRYFISTIIHHPSSDYLLYPDASEIVSSCNSYEELERKLQDELECIYHFSPMPLPENQQTLAKQVKNWLVLNFTTQISYKTLKVLFGYNEKYISALFKAEFGISPSKFISELRMDMAKKLMQNNPDILLKDVAEMVGFTDAFYFSRAFRAYEGISPSQYLRIQKEKNIP